MFLPTQDTTLPLGRYYFFQSRVAAKNKQVTLDSRLACCLPSVGRFEPFGGISANYYKEDWGSKEGAIDTIHLMGKGGGHTKSLGTLVECFKHKLGVRRATNMPPSRD